MNNRLPIEVENGILAENLTETGRALAQAVKALGITLDGYIGEVPNRYYVYQVDEAGLEFSAIHVDENNNRIQKEPTS